MDVERIVSCNLPARVVWTFLIPCLSVVQEIRVGIAMERAGRLLAGLLLLCTLSSTAAQWVMSASQRDDCTMETQRLYHCATYSSPTTLLSDAQKGMCCEAVSQFQVSGCFW